MRSIVAALVATLLSSTAAHAAPLLFSWASENPRENFSFVLGSNPTPNPMVYSGVAFDHLNITDASGKTFDRISFMDADNGGGFDLIADDFIYIETVGALIYAGSTSAPEFAVGQYVLSPRDASPGASVYGGTLTISAITAAVPEPATWAMMLVGFGMIGAASRYRRRSVRTAIA